MEQQLIIFGYNWSDSIVKPADALPGCTERDITSLLSIKEGDPLRSTQLGVLPVSAVLVARVLVNWSQQV